MPIDYTARQLLIYLAVRKILPNVLAEIVAGYCDASKIIGNSEIFFSFWHSQFIVAYARRPLVINVATSMNDSSLKPRVKAEKLASATMSS